MPQPRARQAGFTIIEVVVAVLVVVIGSLATFGLLSAATKNTARAKATQVALDRAQQEIERLRSLRNKELALTATPPPSSDPLNPDYRVSGGSFNLNREGTADYAPLVAEGRELYGGGVVEGAAVSPGPTPFTSGDVTGEVYRYIVWRNDERCSEEKCPGTQDFKQIVVAVKLDKPANQAAERGYVEVQSDFINPTDSKATDPAPNEEGNVITAQQFFLTDTPCAEGGTTERQEITEDHLLHNTLGTCASGQHTGTEYGAPDALLLSPPPDPAPEDSEIPLLYDYSNDYYLNTNPDTTKGVQIVREEETGCSYEPKESWVHPETQLHRWVTDPMGSEFLMTEKVTIEFYTRALGDNESGGAVCIYLFDRHEIEEGGELKAEDTWLTNTSTGLRYWKFTLPSWPRLEWGKERLTMTLSGAPIPILAGDRLGVALSVELAGTPNMEAIPIMYDHPDYPTRIEVDTSTPIEGG